MVQSFGEPPTYWASIQHLIKKNQENRNNEFRYKFPENFHIASTKEQKFDALSGGLQSQPKTFSLTIT